MPTYRALVTLPAATAIAEDAVTNTFHFELDLGSETTQLDALDLALVAFYNNATNGVGIYISTLQSRAANACSIRWYNLNDPVPRVPARTTTWTLQAPATTTGLPTELAVCLSYEAARVSGVAQARRRGRIYIGPLETSAIVTTSGSGRPASGLITRMTASATALKAASATASAPWVVYSPTSGLSPVIASGWVDNACDVQRRRGLRATSRTAWT